MNSYSLIYRFKGFAAAMLGLVLVLSGCATDGSRSTASSAPGSSTPGQFGTANHISTAAPVGEGVAAQEVVTGDVLRSGDFVVITFSGVANPPNRHEERIGADGTIKLTYLGSITAAGKTRRDLEQFITEAYVPRYYQRLTVKIDPDSRFFFVEGEVKTPGRIPYLGKITVLRAIASAGDFTDFAKRKGVKLIRGNGKPITVNCEKAKENPELDVEVLPDDRIMVPRRYF